MIFSKLILVQKRTATILRFLKGERENIKKLSSKKLHFNNELKKGGYFCSFRETFIRETEWSKDSSTGKLFGWTGCLFDLLKN